MNRDLLRSKYFDWISTVILENHENSIKDVNFFLSQMFDTEFRYSIQLDENRYADGLDLRREYAYRCSLDPEIVFETLINYPCSVLEMMVALSIRITNIMDDISENRGVGFWFWNMINNLGFEKIGNSDYNPNDISEILDRFMDREYGIDGFGSLFPNVSGDLRYCDLEIWEQKNGWLNLYI